VRSNVVWCHRSKHQLAWLEPDDEGNLIAVAMIVTPGPEGATVTRHAAPAESVVGPTPATVGCDCGDVWGIDVQRVVTGPGLTMHRARDWPLSSGMSYRRRKHRGR
jgi:hypothetical protein